MLGEGSTANEKSRERPKCLKWEQNVGATLTLYEYGQWATGYDTVYTGTSVAITTTQ